MSRVAYGQKGYIGASMSANARAAYEAGEMPRSKWTKTAILGALRGYCDEMDLLYDPAVESETKAALFDRFIASSSWHHTGAYARETEFFALDEAAVVGAFRELGPEETAERDRIRAQAAAFREGRPKLMQDEARRAAIRETRHRVCTAPILKSIKEIHR